MTISRVTASWWGRHLLLAGFWTGAAVLFVGMRYLGPVLVGADLPDWSEQRWVVLGWMMWIPMTYIVLELARRFPLTTTRWPFYVPLHIGGAVLCSGIGGVLWISLIWVLTGGDIAFGERLQRAFVGAVPIDSLIYFAVLTGVYGLDYYRLHKEEQRQAEQLRADLAEAELTTLRTQLNPHFLFNALNAVASHIRENADEAVQMMAELGDFLRAVLDLGGRHALPLEEEIELLRRYLAVQRIRFGDDLRVHFDVDAAVRDAQVPSLLLQPLVENALHHGLRRRNGDGRIWVTAARTGDRVHLRVMDDGPGPRTRPSARPTRGIGLDNVQRRLRHLFGNRYSLSLGRHVHAGVGVTALTIEIPYREENLAPQHRSDRSSLLPSEHLARGVDASAGGPVAA